MGSPYNARIDERTVLDMCFVPHARGRSVMPQLTLLHQDSRHHQHVISHSIDLHRKTLVLYGDAQGGGGGGGDDGGLQSLD